MCCGSISLFFYPRDLLRSISKEHLIVDQYRISHQSERSLKMPGKSMHTDPAAFTNELIEHAKDEAKKRTGGNDPAPGQEIELDGTITVSKTNPWEICVSIGLVRVCYKTP
jgi:hypothetical protein